MCTNLTTHTLLWRVQLVGSSEKSSRFASIISPEFTPCWKLKHAALMWPPEPLCVLVLGERKRETSACVNDTFGKYVP